VGDGVVRFKALCIDARDPVAVATFWATALHLLADQLDDGDIVLRGRTSTDDVWLNHVDPVPAEQRVALTVGGDAQLVSDLVALGGGVLRGREEPTDPWALRDPEGGVLYVVPDERGLREVMVDAADPEALARWWAAMLGGVAAAASGGGWYVADVPAAPFAALRFVAGGGQRQAKIRTHWDVDGDYEDVLARGATLVRRRDDEIDWDICADPEGNEFCVFAEERP